MGRHVRKKNRVPWLLMGLLLLFLLAGTSYLATRGYLAKSDHSTATKEETAKSSAAASTTLSFEEPSIEESSLETSTTIEIAETAETTASSGTKTADLEAAAGRLEENAGKAYYAVHYFGSNETVASPTSARVASASLIKVFIMEYALNQAASGQVKADQLIEGRTLNQWLTPMIQQSDNTAANTLIDFFGMESLNLYFQTQGYQDTRLERHMLDDAARSAGQDNYTSLNDCMAFLNRLYQQQGTAPYAEMLALLEGQQVRTKIPSKLPADVVTANKTGELADVENDIGIVFAQENPFAITVLTQNVQNTAGIRDAIGDFSNAAYQKALAK